MKQFFRVFFSFWFWLAFAVFCLSALVYWVGPLVSIADFFPLKSWWSRALLLVGLWVAYGLAFFFSVKKKAGKHTPVQDSSDLLEDRKQDIQSLERGFSKALSVLKSVRQEAGTSIFHRFFARFDQQSGLYRFPWFITLGAPNSGKTTALKSSGFRFRVSEASDADPVGQQNCQWMFADEAVVLDLAGRYTLQADNRLKDATDWSGFLKLLKRTRTRQPLNGVFVTVAADVLVQGSQADLMNQANAIRQRLYELQHELSLEVPVYFLVSKCDLIAGFNEFFDSLSLEERQQVWGLTLELPNDKKSPVNLSSFVSRVDGLFVNPQPTRLDYFEDFQL